VRRIFALAIVLLATPAAAQQQPDSATLQRIIGVLSVQRNDAMNSAANAQVQAAALAEENAKLKAQVEELTKKAEPQK
jgi:hypothetical protein